LKRICHITLNPVEQERRVLNEIQSGNALNYKNWIITCGSPGQNKKEITQEYDLFRIKTYNFQTGPLKFIIFNIRLFLFLLFKPLDIIHCHDLWPLPAAAFLALLKNTALVYDAHEYYAGLKILEDRPVKRFVWLFFEWLAIPVVDMLLTVSIPLGTLFKKRYPQLKKVEIIRNLPLPEKPDINKVPDIECKNNEKTIFYHGHFKPGRGLEPLIKSMKFINNAQLLLVGGGELKEYLINLVAENKLENKIRFREYIQNELLISYAAQADIGTVLFESSSINYSYALPNKFFEYIMAGLPVLASNIETLEQYILKYDIGKTVEPSDPKLIASVLNEMLANQANLYKWKKNSFSAAKELNWDVESDKMIQIYQDVSI